MEKESNGLEDDKLHFVRNLKFGEVEIEISQECVGDVGCVVWDSAIVACHYFARQWSSWKGKKVLELGAGTGVCSILLAAFGANVTATDLPDRMNLLGKNIEKNWKAVVENGGSIKAEVLDWNDPSDEPLQFDVVIMIDALYYLKALEGLVKTLLRMDACTIICCYEERDIGEPEIAQKRFFEIISSTFDVSPIADSELDPVCQSPDIKPVHFIQLKLTYHVETFWK